MKINRYVLCVLGVCLIGSAGARPVDLSAPSAQVGSADLNGNLQLYREVDGVGLDMGPGSYLPLRIKFSTAADTGGMLGPGFYCPMFETRNVLIREQMMRAFLPCGKGLYLRRSTTDPTKFQTVDQEWTGLLTGDDFVMWREDGWKLAYHQGRLSSIQTDNNHTFNWSYNDQGVATGVSEDGKQAINVESDPSGKVTAFNFAGKRYAVDFADRPEMESISGQTLVGKMVSSLSTFHYPDGRTENYKVLLATPGLVPTLDFIGADKAETLYTWDAANGHIASEKGPDGNWTYTVGDVTEKFGVPAISRANAKGQTEGMALDNATGTYTATNLDGSTVVTHTFKTAGPLYGKVHKVEKTLNGVTSTIYQASYDEMGRLIRKIDEAGITTSYAYNSAGNLTSQKASLSTERQALLRAKEEKLLKDLAGATSQSARSNEAEALGLFYVHERGDLAKALALLPQISDSNQRFDLRLHAIYYGNLTSDQKKQAFQQLARDFPGRQQVLQPYLSMY